MTQFQEIERKYLILQWSQAAQKMLREEGEITHIKQGYFAQEPVTRVRLIYGRGFQRAERTVKSSGLFNRSEITNEIDFHEGEQLLKLTPYIIEKIRIHCGRYEFDFFLGKLAGLQVLEIELNQPNERIALPTGLSVHEVTFDTRFANVNLSRLNNLSELGMKRFEAIQFEHMHDGLEALIKHIDAKVTQIPVGSFLCVGICGPSSSGKGYITDALVKHFGASAAVFHLDNYFVGLNKMGKLGISSFDMPFALDLQEAARHIARLKQQNFIRVPQYSFKKGERVGEVKLMRPTRLLIIEGLYALHPVFQGLVDLGVFVDIDVHGAFCRRMRRDTAGRTGQQADEVFEMFAMQVHPKGKLFIAPQKDFAHFVVVNEMNPGLEVRFEEDSDELQHKVLISLSSALDDNGRFITTKIEDILQQEGFAEQKPLSPFHQVDTYYEAPSQHWRGEELMRVRITTDATGAISYSLAYKGPRDATGFLSGARKAQVFKIQPHQQEYLHAKLGYRTLGTLKKMRRIFRTPASNMRIALDTILNYDGIWLEASSKNAKDVNDFMQKLREAGLPVERFSAISYFEFYILKT